MSVKSSVLLSVFAAIAVVCVAAFVVPVAPKNSTSLGELGPVAMYDLAGVVGGAEGFSCVLGSLSECGNTDELFPCTGCISGNDPVGSSVASYTERSGNSGYFPSSTSQINSTTPHYPATVNCDRLMSCTVSTRDPHQTCAGGSTSGPTVACINPAVGSPATGCLYLASGDDAYWYQAGFGTCVDP